MSPADQTLLPATSSDLSHEDVSSLQLSHAPAPPQQAAKPGILKHRPGPGPGPGHYHGDTDTGTWYTNPMEAAYFATGTTTLPHQVSSNHPTSSTQDHGAAGGYSTLQPQSRAAAAGLAYYGHPHHPASTRRGHARGFGLNNIIPDAK